MSEVTKTCIKCRVQKSRDDYHKSSKAPDGLNTICKICTTVYQKSKYSENPLKFKESNKASCKKRDPIKHNISRRKRRATKAGIYRAKAREWYRDISDRVKTLVKKHRMISEYRAKKVQYERNRKLNDINHKLKSILRTRLYISLKKNSKVISHIEALNCTVEELKLHLESQFVEGMSWENWNHEGWHIDHIIPLHKFDLTDYDEVAKACHYSNLRPSWAKDNLSRKYEDIRYEEDGKEVKT